MYLGDKLDHCLSWCPRIDYVCSKANKLLGFLKRNLQSCPRVKIQTIYYTSVRILCTNMGPIYHQSDISKIEMIQHMYRAARFVLKKPCMEEKLSGYYFIYVSRSAVAITISAAKVCKINISYCSYKSLDC